MTDWKEKAEMLNEKAASLFSQCCDQQDHIEALTEEIKDIKKLAHNFIKLAEELILHNATGKGESDGTATALAQVLLEEAIQKPLPQANTEKEV